MATLKKITSPTKEIEEIIKQRIRGSKEIKTKWEESDHSAIVLVHGNPAELLFAADLAQKTANVTIFELTGTCQFHFSMIALVGDISSVNMAAESINLSLGKK